VRSLRRWSWIGLLGGLVAPGGCGAFLPDQNPFDGYVWINPGVKLGYTFGEGGGFTYGGELSVIIPTGTEASTVLAAGPVLNLTWTHRGTFNGRLGAQIVSWLWGIEAGPALVRDRSGRHFGFGVTPWVGAIVVPYWTYTVVAGSSNLNEWGLYGKLPLCTGSNCDYSGGGDGGD
jgi:hypothetical protein